MHYSSSYGRNTQKTLLWWKVKSWEPIHDRVEERGLYTIETERQEKKKQGSREIKKGRAGQSLHIINHVD